MLPEGLQGLFRPDTAAAYACRPVAARSAERHTVFGVFSGSIGLMAVPEFKAALYSLAENESVKVILDFQNVSLSRSAVAALVAFAASMHGRNKRLYLFRPSQTLRAELKKLDLRDFFTIHNEEEDIIASLIV